MEPCGTALAAHDRHYLLDLARRSIEHGLSEARALIPDDYPARLAAPAACFVTLRLTGRLRGCVGHLKPRCALAEAVARNAYSAAFSDPRFAAVEAGEYRRLDVQISVLSAPDRLSFRDEAQLLAQLLPGRHGLIIEAGDRQATFLPSVWQQIPEPQAFLRQLKIKAGLDPDTAADRLLAWRYSTDTFPVYP